MKIFPLIFFIFFASSIALNQEYHVITKDYRLKFPEDFYYKKDYRVQWWYFTGHLFDQTGKEFGYELTFFVAGVQKKAYRSRFALRNIYISHFALSDVANKIFLFSDKSDSGAFDFAGAREDRLKVWVGKNIVEGIPKRMHLHAFDDNKSLDLILIPTKPVILHGENGYSRKSEESTATASFYFSYTNMKTKGSLRIGNKTVMVKGKSWFDREILSRGFWQNQIAWDWFSIKLNDNREIMLYLLRHRDGPIDKNSSGTFIYSDGTYRHLSKEEFDVHVLSYYRSRKTHARYPAKWKIKIPSEGIELTLVPVMEDQELTTAYLTFNYWEGVCSVEGAVSGKAYVEMTGYTR